MSGLTQSNIPTAEQLEAEGKRLRRRKDFVRLLVSTLSSLVVVAAVAVLLSLLFLPVLQILLL